MPQRESMPENESSLPANAVAELALMLAETKDVFPGKVLVRRTKTRGAIAYPILDHEFDPAHERIVGVSLWGPFNDHHPGMWRLGDDPEEQYVQPISSDGFRPLVGVPQIDSWIARADAVRHRLSTGMFTSISGDFSAPLTPACLYAAFGKIIRRMRQSAADLLISAPVSLAGKLLAMAAVADEAKPNPTLIKEAIQELLTVAQIWNTHPVNTREHRSIQNSGSRPTMRDLVEAVGFSDDTFRRIRTAAGIKTTQRGHSARNRKYSVDEVDQMLEAVRNGNYELRSTIIDTWSSWSSNSAAS